MARLERARQRAAVVFSQRCFYLFSALVLLVGLAPILLTSVGGRIAANAISMLVLIAAVAAVGRTRLSFVIALSLALPNLVLQLLGILLADRAGLLALSWAFGAAFYLVTLVYLLAYVFRREVMDADKLYGAAAAYLMIGVIWSYLFRIVYYLYPEAYVFAPPLAADEQPSFLYTAFGMLTNAGIVDATPVQPLSKSLATLAQINGVLFVAILIARLAGIYPPQQRK